MLYIQEFSYKNFWILILEVNSSSPTLSVCKCLCIVCMHSMYVQYVNDITVFYSSHTWHDVSSMLCIYNNICVIMIRMHASDIVIFVITTLIYGYDYFELYRGLCIRSLTI